MGRRSYKRIFEVRSGNMIGVVEEPMVVESGTPLSEQRRVRIGVIDAARARKEPFSRADAKRVVDQLYRHIVDVLKGE